MKEGAIAPTPLPSSTQPKRMKVSFSSQSMPASSDYNEDDASGMDEDYDDDDMEDELHRKVMGRYRSFDFIYEDSLTVRSPRFLNHSNWVTEKKLETIVCYPTLQPFDPPPQTKEIFSYR